MGALALELDSGSFKDCISSRSPPKRRTPDFGMAMASWQQLKKLYFKYQHQMDTYRELWHLVLVRRNIAFFLISYSFLYLLSNPPQPFYPSYSFLLSLKFSPNLVFNLPSFFTGKFWVAEHRLNLKGTKKMKCQHQNFIKDEYPNSGGFKDNILMLDVLPKKDRQAGMSKFLQVGICATSTRHLHHL